MTCDGYDSMTYGADLVRVPLVLNFLVEYELWR